MKLAALTADQSFCGCLHYSEVVPALRIKSIGIEPTLCFDPNAPLEIDFEILDKLPVAQLQQIATLSSTCAQVVQAYGQARGLWVVIPL